MIKVIYMDTNIFENNELYEKALSLVSKDRKERISNFKTINPARLSLGAGLLLHIALRENGLDEFINTLCYEPYGKPYFKDINFHFSLSHSGKYAICAYGTTPLGIDLQKTSGKIKHVNRILSDKEKDFLSPLNTSQKTELFFRLWVRKESLIKWDGRGLRLPLDTLSFVDDHAISDSILFEEKELHFIEVKSLLPEYALCICSEEKEASIVMNKIDANFLTKY